MEDHHTDPLRQELRAAGLDISTRNFLRAFRLAIDQQRAALHGALEAEMSEAEVAAYAAGGFDLKPRETGAGGPIEHTLAEFVAMIAESLGVEETAQLLGIDRSNVHQCVTEGTLYSFCHDKQTLIPLFQFERGRSLPGLDRVLHVLDPSAHPLSVFRFFMTPQPDLVVEHGDGARQVSPRDWLRFGRDPKAVADLARELVLL